MLGGLCVVELTEKTDDLREKGRRLKMERVRIGIRVRF